MSHKKIMEKCSEKLMKDAKHYKKEMKHESGKEKKEEKAEMKEAFRGGKVMKKMAKKSHEGKD